MTDESVPVRFRQICINWAMVSMLLAAAGVFCGCEGKHKAALPPKRDLTESTRAARLLWSGDPRGLQFALQVDGDEKVIKTRYVSVLWLHIKNNSAKTAHGDWHPFSVWLEAEGIEFSKGIHDSREPRHKVGPGETIKIRHLLSASRHKGRIHFGIAGGCRGKVEAPSGTATVTLKFKVVVYKGRKWKYVRTNPVTLTLHPPSWPYPALSEKQRPDKKP